MIDENVKRCFDKICENFGVTADLCISPPIQARGTREERLVTFVDIHTSSYFDVSGREILSCRVKSKKDYKNLRRLVRRRLISSLRDMKDLAEESLRSLGAKI